MKDLIVTLANGEPAGTLKQWSERLAGLATRGRWPWIDRYLVGLKSPLGVLLVSAFISLLCGLFVAPQGYAILAVVLLVVTIGVVWPWIALQGLRCTLTFTAIRGHEGRPTQARLTVCNRSPFPVWGLTIDGVLSAGDSATEVALARVGGWSKSTYLIDMTPSRRGVLPDAKPIIATGFPFGLSRATKNVEVERRLVVWPETFDLPSPFVSSSPSDRVTESASSHTGKVGGRDGLRDYRRGDSLRDIHWSKSATYDRLVVSEREGVSRHEAIITVDVEPERHFGTGRDSSLEWALRVAASLCRAVTAENGAVELRLGAQTVHAAGPSGGLEKLLDAIAHHTEAASTCRQTPPARVRHSREAACFEIGTRPSSERRVKSIVLDPVGFGAPLSAAADDFGAWMVLRSPAEVAGRLRRQPRARNTRFSCAS